MFAIPISCPLLSDTTHVYKILINFADTAIVSACTDWFDHCHEKIAPDWSVWHVRMTFSWSQSMIPAPNVGVVVIVTLAVATVPNSVYTLLTIIKHLPNVIKNVSKQTRQISVSTNISTIDILSMFRPDAPIYAPAAY